MPEKITPEAAIIRLNRIRTNTGERPPEIDMAIKAINRQFVKRKLEPEPRYYGIGRCPTCHAVFMDKSTNHFGNCGQALDTTFKKLKPYKKSVKIYFNKRTTQTSGYQIMHSAHSDFKTCRTKTLWSNKYSSYTCRQVVRKQTYYFKIRTIKEVGNDIYVSGWSKAYKVKTK